MKRPWTVDTRRLKGRSEVRGKQARGTRIEVRGARKRKTGSGNGAEGSGLRAEGSGKEGRQERGARNWNCYKATSGSVNWELGAVEAIRRRGSGS